MIRQLKPFALAVALPLAAVAPWSPAQATLGVPAGGDLRFTVLRDGSEVGTHTIRFGNGKADGEITVDVETHVNVKLPIIGVSVYHFEHEGHEVWRGGALQALQSTTDDDGEAKALEVSRRGGQLRVQGSRADGSSAGDLIPASLWSPQVVHQHVLLNTLDGQEMSVQVSDRGVEQVDVHGQPVQARHYVVSGGLNRELWYDQDGVLVKVAFAARDDSRIEYVLR